MKRILASALFASVLTAAACGSKDPTEHFRRGGDYVQQKKYQEAIVELRTAVQIAPNYGEARLKLAEAFEAVGDLPGALRESVRAADLLPDNMAAQVLAGRHLMFAQSFQDAGDRADRVLAKDPNNAEALILKGAALAGLNDFDAALTRYEQAAKTSPGNETGYIGIGALELTRGQQQAAEEAFKRAVSINPKSVSARVALADLYWRTRQIEAAEKQLKAALELEPRNPLLNRALGVLHLATGRAAQAEGYFVAYAESLGTSAGQFTLANLYMSLQRPADARRVLAEAAKQPDAFAEATTSLASLDLLDGKAEEARKGIETVLARFPKHVNALVLKAQVLSNERKYDQALAEIASALAVEPNNAAAHLSEGNIYADTSRVTEAIAAYESVLKSDTKNPLQVHEANFRLGAIHLELGSLDRAMTHAQAALQVQPSSANAHLLAARIETGRGQLSEARRRLAALKGAFPNAAPVAVLRGQIELAAKQPALAAAAFQEALKHDPANVEALTALAKMDLAAGRRKEALERVESSLRQPNPSVDLLVLAGQVYGAAGELPKAEKSLLAAVEREPNRFDAYTRLGQLYAAQGRLPEAVKQIEAILDRNPKAVGSNTTLGVLLQMSGRMADAERAYENTLAVDPRAGVAANNLAWLLVESQRDLDRALGLAQVASVAMPDVAAVSDTLGWVYYRKNLPQLALPPLLKAVKAEPRNPEFHYHLGAVYAATGDKVKARHSLTQALELKLGSNDAKHARSLLESL